MILFYLLRFFVLLFLQLVLDIWPLGLIDSRVMHNLLFCLINLSADSSSASGVIFAATTPATSSLCGEVPQISPCSHSATGMFFSISPFTNFMGVHCFTFGILCCRCLRNSVDSPAHHHIIQLLLFVPIKFCINAYH